MKKIKKLQLDKETIKVLAGRNLRRVRGGEYSDAYSDIPYDCNGDSANLCYDSLAPTACHGPCITSLCQRF